MAGNRGIYNAAMKRAQAHTWKEKWAAALKEYRRAVDEFPNDMDARLGAAAAYIGLKKWKDALALYEQLQQADPKNTVILERLAEVYLQMKDMARVQEIHFRLSNQYVLRRQIPQAIETLNRLSELLPQNEEVMIRLGRLYQEAGDRASAVRVQLERVRILFHDKRLNEAMVLAEETFRLAPDNRQAKELVFRLRRELSARKERGEDVGVSAEGAVSNYQMAEWVREAMELQEKGDVERAIHLYERAVQAGLKQGDVHYSLGLLYHESGELEKAIEQLQTASVDDEYALSGHYAMGECYRDLGNMDRAAQEFERAIHLVDLQSIGRDAAQDLIQMYEAACQVHEGRGDLARAASLYTTLAGFLQGKRWRRGRTDEFRKRAQELTEKSMFAKLRQLGTGILPAIEDHARGETREPLGQMDRPQSAIPSLTEDALRPITDFLRTAGRPGDFEIEQPTTVVEIKPLEEALAIVPPVPVQLPVRELDTSNLDEQVRELAKASQVYLERGLFNATIDACFEVIHQSPDYLPIHLRLAEVYERQAHPEMALSKYQALINTHLARGEKEPAVYVYQALLALSPDAVSSRSRLADLLIELERPQEAAQELVHVAHNYFRLGQTNQAIETFREARTLTPEDKAVHLEYGLFLLKMDRPESAIAELRRALQLDPHEPLGLVRMNIAFVLANEEETFWKSLTTVLKRADADEAALWSIVQEYKDILLFQESPQLYYALGLLQRQAGHISEAVETYDRALGLFPATASDPLQLQLCRGLAEGYLKLNRSDEAVRILQRGLEWADILALAESDLPPDDVAAVPSQLSFYHWLAEAYAKADRLEQAIAALGQAKVAHPFDRETSTKLADLYFRQGDLRQALGELTELVQHYEQRNQLDRALEILQHMNRLAPSNLAVRERLSNLYIRRGYIDKGLEELEALAELQEKRGRIEEAAGSLQRMTEIFWTMGQHDRAYQIYDRIVTLVPEDVSARQQLINLHILAGRLADALEEQRNIARINLKQQRVEDAVAALHQVIALDPQDTWAMRQLAELLSSIGEHRQSVRLYRRLAPLVPGDPEIAAQIEVEEQLSGSQDK